MCLSVSLWKCLLQLLSHALIIKPQLNLKVDPGQVQLVLIAGTGSSVRDVSYQFCVSLGTVPWYLYSAHTFGLLSRLLMILQCNVLYNTILGYNLKYFCPCSSSFSP